MAGESTTEAMLGTENGVEPSPVVRVEEIDVGIECRMDISCIEFFNFELPKARKKFHREFSRRLNYRLKVFSLTK